jgi:hypothetical protein
MGTSKIAKSFLIDKLVSRSGSQLVKEEVRAGDAKGCDGVGKRTEVVLLE